MAAVAAVAGPLSIWVGAQMIKRRTTAETRERDANTDSITSRQLREEYAWAMEQIRALRIELQQLRAELDKAIEEARLLRVDLADERAARLKTEEENVRLRANQVPPELASKRGFPESSTILHRAFDPKENKDASDE